MPSPSPPAYLRIQSQLCGVWLLVRDHHVSAHRRPQEISCKSWYLGGFTLVYQTKVRSILEFAAPVFHSSLTSDQSRQIESIQKKALAIILGNEYESYETALTKLSLERLDLRQTRLCYSFASKCSKSARHSAMFPLNNMSIHNTRHPKKYLEPSCNTSRYFNSSIPFMSRLLNKPPIAN